MTVWSKRLLDSIKGTRNKYNYVQGELNKAMLSDIGITYAGEFVEFSLNSRDDDAPIMYEDLYNFNGHPLPEVIQWFIINEWLVNHLKERGEVVGLTPNGNGVWGKTSSGAPDEHWAITEIQQEVEYGGVNPFLEDKKNNFQHDDKEANHEDVMNTVIEIKDEQEEENIIVDGTEITVVTTVGRGGDSVRVEVSFVAGVSFDESQFPFWGDGTIECCSIELSEQQEIAFGNGDEFEIEVPTDKLREAIKNWQVEYAISDGDNEES